MTDDDRTAFLAGERPDEVLIYLASAAVSDTDTLAEYGRSVENGVVFVLDGERGRRVAGQAMGLDPMELAQQATGREGTIDLDEFVGECPVAGNGSTAEDDPSASHALRSVFAFAEERNEEVGGIYAEGDVIHAYAVCSCGIAYSDRWVA